MLIGDESRGPVGGSSVALPAENYAVGGEIARGGMGSILEAEDRNLGRKVAMKVARLEHPNIVPIHELGWDAENRLF